MSGMGTGGTGYSGGGMGDDLSGGRTSGFPGSGTAEVHTDLHSGTTQEYGGLGFAEEQGGQQGLRERATSRLHDVGDTLRGGAETVKDRAKTAAHTVADRAGTVAGQARERASAAVGKAEGALERAGVLEQVRRNALPALGVAFGVGLLLAGRDNQVIKPGSKMYRAKSQVRDAVLTGLTGAIATEARSMLGSAGQSGFLSTLMDSLERKLTGDGGQQGRMAGQGGGYGSGGAMRSGSAGGTGSTGMGGGSTTSRGTTGTGTGTYAGQHRPPSHQENL